MTRDVNNTTGARALRLAGYVKCPTWWLTTEQFELLKYMAVKNLPDINRIKAEAEEKAVAGHKLTR
jgi:hypothetical protein